MKVRVDIILLPLFDAPFRTFHGEEEDILPEAVTRNVNPHRT
jgi:hypothetical protein